MIHVILIMNEEQSLCNQERNFIASQKPMNYTTKSPWIVDHHVQHHCRLSKGLFHLVSDTAAAAGLKPASHTKHSICPAFSASAGNQVSISQKYVARLLTVSRRVHEKLRV